MSRLIVNQRLIPFLLHRLLPRLAVLQHCLRQGALFNCQMFVTLGHATRLLRLVLHLDLRPRIPFASFLWLLIFVLGQLEDRFPIQLQKLKVRRCSLNLLVASR